MWVRALNDVLTADVRILNSQVVKNDFHSRFMADFREYRYTIMIGTIDPFRARYAYERWRDLDLDRMRLAAKSLVGLHDFRAFTEELQPHIENTMRRLFAVEANRVRDEIRIEIAGTAFLRGMMRRIAGGLFEVGKGSRDPKDIARLLTLERETMHLPVVLPAKGLTLMRVVYGRHPKDNRDETASDKGND